MPHTILLAGGGTGGHVYPALAMGDALRARGHTVLYLGEPSRLEGRVAPQRGYAFHAVEALAYPRSGLFTKVRFAWKLLLAAFRSRRQVKALGGTLVLGVGGYVMAPTVIGAAMLGVPCVIHEANATPGLANRLCARVARLVLLTFEATADKIPGNVERILTGCPVNPKILDGDRAVAAARYGLDPARPTLLVVGGSLGAATINQVALAAAIAWKGRLQILHITGPRYHAEVLQTYKDALGELPATLCVRDYEDKMGEAYAMADLVLSRAGSSTLSEVCVLGKPVVMIPSPNVTDNHQEGNARALERVRAGIVFVENGLNPAEAVEAMQNLLEDPEALARMGTAARSLGQLGVAERVADLIEARFPPP